jgi:hypothetical protein
VREHILCSSVCVSDAPGLFIRVINAPKFAAKKKLTILLSLIFFFYPGFLFGSYTPQKLQQFPVFLNVFLMCVSDVPGPFIRVVHAPKVAAAPDTCEVWQCKVHWFGPIWREHILDSKRTHLYSNETLQRFPTLAKCASVKFTDLDLLGTHQEHMRNTLGTHVPDTCEVRQCEVHRFYHRQFRISRAHRA